MVAVPVSNERRVQVQPLDNAPLRYAAADNLVGPAVEELGRAGQRAANDLDHVEAVYDQADALNLDNTFAAEAADAQRQFGNLRGDQPGRELADQVKALQDRAEQLAKGARSQRAGEIVRRALAVRLQNTQDQMATHADAEMFKFRDGALVAGRNQAADDAIEQAGTPQFHVAIGTGLTRIQERAALHGLPPEEVAHERAQFLDEVHGGVLDKMFSVPDPNLNDIAHYLDVNGGEMTNKLKSETMARLQKPLQDRQSRSDADLVMGLAVPEEKAPVSGSKPNLDAITAKAESGGREFTASGARVTSPAGARGEMQVMPATARDPGFGIKPSDGSPEQDKRVGKQYRAKMEERYGGDLQKMWGAYNWGPGNVDKAIREHGDNWLAHAPAETQRYVLANVAAAGGAGNAYTGQAKQWDKSAVYSAIDKKAEAEGWTPERTERARQEVDRRISRDEGLLQDQQSAADEAAATILQQKGDSFRTSMIPPAVWARLKPTDKIQYQKIETELRKPKEPAANGDTVVALHRMAITDPDQFAGLNLEKYRPFITAGEFDELGAAQARAGKPDSAFNPRPKIDATISSQKKWSGIDVDKDATEGFRVRRYIEAQADAAKAGGKEPTQQDYDRWFADATKAVKVQRSFAGFDLLRPDTEKRASQILSQPYRDLIRRQFRSVNGRWPTEDETQEWFAKMGQPG